MENLFENLILLSKVSCKVGNGELFLLGEEKSCGMKRSAHEIETTIYDDEVNQENQKKKKLEILYRGDVVLNHISEQEINHPKNNINNKKKKPRRAKPKLSLQFMELKQREPTIPEELKNKIEESSGGSSNNLSCVLTKQLCFTDVSDSHGRLLIPKGQILNGEFLGVEEDTKAENEGIFAPTMGPSLNDCFVQLRKWKMKSTVYALVKGWKDIKNANDFKEGDIIQLWSFGRASELNFAIVKIPRNSASPTTAALESAAIIKAHNISRFNC